MEESFLLYILSLPGLVAISIVEYMFLFCHVISQNHVIYGHVALSVEDAQGKSLSFQALQP